MTTRNAATPIIRLAARILRVHATELRKLSVGGAGKIWPNGRQKEQQRHDLALTLAGQLEDLSAALNNQVVVVDHEPRIESIEKAAA